MKKIVLIVLALILAGCGGTKDAPTPQKQIIKKQIKKVTKTSSTQPRWILNPNIDGEDGAVGIVKLMKNKAKQKYIAKKLAIASMQERKRVEVDTKVTINQRVQNKKSTLVSTQETKQTSSHFKTQNLVKKADYSDKEYYYIWMVVKK